MNKLVKKSIAGVLATVMAATSLVGSITAFADITDGEYLAASLAAAKMTAGTKYTFERVDGFKKDPQTNQDTTEVNDQVVYSFIPETSGTYVINFSSDAYIPVKTTNLRQDTPAYLDVYAYDKDNNKTTLVNSLPSYSQEVTVKSQYVAKNTNPNFATATGTNVIYDGYRQVDLESGYEYIFKIEQNKYGSYKDGSTEKVRDTANEDAQHPVVWKEVEKTTYTKAYVSISKAEFKTTFENPGPIALESSWTKTPATAAEASKDGRGGYTQTWTYEKTCAVKFVGDASDIVIPDTINGYKVTKVNALETSETSNDFIPKSRITSVKMGANVKTIANGAFSGCVLMSSLTLNEGLEKIGQLAFYKCGMLTGELVIPASVKEVGSMAFYNTGYSSAKINGKDTVIKEMAIGYTDVLNENTADPTDTYSAPKAGFYMTAPTGGKAYEYASKFAVKGIDPANCTHEFEETETKAATIYAKGSKTYTCKVCGTVKTEAIAQKKVAIKSVKSSKKGAMTVKTKAVTDKVTAYKVQYSTNKNFKNAKTVTVKTTKKALSKTITGLKAGKKYYVRVKAVNGSKKSAFSATKTVKIKK